jgi:predicted short-subunit dehydrogenase-like oxidoreductase (DUF2520 family)
MASSFAVVGPGRVGSALARHWQQSGFRCAGFVGRDPATIRVALEFAGAGRALTLTEAAGADFVLLSVGDDQLAEVARSAAAQVRRDTLWLHCSGRHDLAPLAPLAAAGARIGSLHPLCPFPTAAIGYARLPGCPGVIEAAPPVARRLAVLARKAGLVPVVAGGGDRVLYHAACALGTNGVTALHELVERGFAGAGIADARRLATAALQAGLGASDAAGAEAALSGPVARGDATLIAAHLAALQSAAPAALPVYRELMRHAVALALRRRSLDAASAERLARRLDPAGDG